MDYAELCADGVTDENEVPSPSDMREAGATRDASLLVVLDDLDIYL